MVTTHGIEVTHEDEAAWDAALSSFQHAFGYRRPPPAGAPCAGDPAEALLGCLALGPGGLALVR